MATIEATAPTITPFDVDRQRRVIRDTIASRYFATLATSSNTHIPHVAGIQYSVVDGALYISTGATSIKARNIRQNPRVALTIPVRKLPIGPPFTIQFQGTAEILAVDDPHIRKLHAEGKLKRVTSQGELEYPDGCLLKVTPGRRMITYGLGVPLLAFLRDPLTANRSVDWQ